MEEPMVEMIGEGGKRVLVSPYIAKQKSVLRKQGLRPAPEVIPAKPERPPMAVQSDIIDDPNAGSEPSTQSSEEDADRA